MHHHLQFVSLFIIVYHLVDVIECIILQSPCDMSWVHSWSHIWWSWIVMLVIARALHLQDVSLSTIVYRLVDVIEFWIRFFLWYVMSPLMMSYSMMFYVNAFQRSCWSSLACKSMHHCLSSCRCLWVMNSILLVRCHESTNDLIFNYLGSLCLSSPVLCIFRM